MALYMLLQTLFIRFWWGQCKATKPIYWGSQELLVKHKCNNGEVGLRDNSKVNVAMVFK